jgi:hypothetical protein
MKLINSLWRWTISAQVPIKRINIIKLKTCHLSGIELDNKGCSWETTTRSELITILIEEEGKWNDEQAQECFAWIFLGGIGAVVLLSTFAL